MADRTDLLMGLVDAVPAMVEGSESLPEYLAAALEQDFRLRSELEFLRHTYQALSQMGADVGMEQPPAAVESRVRAMLEDPSLLLCARASSAWRRHRPATEEALLAYARGQTEQAQRQRLERWTGGGQLTCTDCAVRCAEALAHVEHHERLRMAAATHETRPAARAVTLTCLRQWRLRLEPHSINPEQTVVSVYPPPTASPEPGVKLIIGLHVQAARRRNWSVGSRLFDTIPVRTLQGEALWAIIPADLDEIAFVGLVLP